jgi:hypothetical protein
MTAGQAKQLLKGWSQQLATARAESSNNPQIIAKNALQNKTTNGGKLQASDLQTITTAIQGMDDPSSYLASLNIDIPPNQMDGDTFALPSMDGKLVVVDGMPGVVKQSVVDGPNGKVLRTTVFDASGNQIMQATDSAPMNTGRLNTDLALQHGGVATVTRTVSERDNPKHGTVYEYRHVMADGTVFVNYYGNGSGESWGEGL